MIRQLRAVHSFQEDTSIVRLSLWPSRRSSGFSSIDAFIPALAPAGRRRPGESPLQRAREDPPTPSPRRGKRDT